MVLALFVLVLAATANAQLVRTANGNIILEANGAQLTLSGGASCAAPGTIASISDVNAAVSGAVAHTQPQINNAVSTALATLALATAMQQTEATTRANLSSQILSSALTAAALDTRVTSVSSAVAAGNAALTARLDGLLPTIDAKTNASLVSISALIGGQLGVSLQTTTSRIDSLSVAIGSARDSAGVQAANIVTTQTSAAAFSTQVQVLTTSLSTAVVDGLRSAALSAAAISTRLAANVDNLQLLFNGLSMAVVSGQTSVATFSSQVTALTGSLSAAIVTATASLARTSSAVVDTSTALSATNILANAASAGVVSGQTVPFFQYDTGTTPRVVTSTLMTPAQALCVTRLGVWDSTARVCNNPLALGATALTRTGTDADAIASCPTGYTPADCQTAYFLLNFWRMDINTQIGEAWCAGSIDGGLNTDFGKRAMPGYWAAADNNNGRPYMCSVGAALVIDQCTRAENGCVGRPSPARPHWYCRGETAPQRWMCMAINMP